MLTYITLHFRISRVIVCALIIVCVNTCEKMAALPTPEEWATFQKEMEKMKLELDMLRLEHNDVVYCSKCRNVGRKHDYCQENENPPRGALTTFEILRNNETREARWETQSVKDELQKVSERNWHLERAKEQDNEYIQECQGEMFRLESEVRTLREDLKHLEDDDFALEEEMIKNGNLMNQIKKLEEEREKQELEIESMKIDFNLVYKTLVQKQKGNIDAPLILDFDQDHNLIGRSPSTIWFEHKEKLLRKEQVSLKKFVEKVVFSQPSSPSSFSQEDWDYSFPTSEKDED